MLNKEGDEDMLITILKSDRCPHCTELMRRIKSQGGIPGNQIRFLDILTDERGMELADKYNIDAVPTAITDEGKECRIVYDDSKDTVTITCPKK
jgi:hypothetical protein